MLICETSSTFPAGGFREAAVYCGQSSTRTPCGLTAKFLIWEDRSSPFLPRRVRSAVVVTRIESGCAGTKSPNTFYDFLSGVAVN